MFPCCRHAQQGRLLQWHPDSELADGHRGECHYCRMAEVMEQLDAARVDLLDDNDELAGRVKDVEEVEKRLRHRPLQHNAWRLVPFFELFMSEPKDELHQCDSVVCNLLAYVYICWHMYILSYTCICRYIRIYA